jgi:hypothetical protein
MRDCWSEVDCRKWHVIAGDGDFGGAHKLGIVVSEKRDHRGALRRIHAGDHRVITRREDRGLENPVRAKFDDIEKWTTPLAFESMTRTMSWRGCLLLAPKSAEKPLDTYTSASDNGDAALFMGRHTYER